MTNVTKGILTLGVVLVLAVMLGVDRVPRPAKGDELQAGGGGALSEVAIGYYTCLGAATGLPAWQRDDPCRAGRCRRGVSGSDRRAASGARGAAVQRKRRAADRRDP